jgi:hypothetical protein
MLILGGHAGLRVGWSHVRFAFEIAEMEGCSEKGRRGCPEAEKASVRQSGQQDGGL